MVRKTITQSDVMGAETDLMAECDVCYRPTANRQRLCRECREWRIYWDSLTPEEQSAEQRSMAAHVADRDPVVIR